MNQIKQKQKINLLKQQKLKEEETEKWAEKQGRRKQVVGEGEACAPQTWFTLYLSHFLAPSCCSFI
jgi:hypothetical protein